jgi:hypothetical protein
MYPNYNMKDDEIYDMICDRSTDAKSKLSESLWPRKYLVVKDITLEIPDSDAFII